MAAAGAYLLLLARDRWSLYPAAPGPITSTPQALAAGMSPEASMFANEVARHTASSPVIIALSSRDCFVASVSTAGLPRRGRDAALLYRLEDALPLAAEDVIASFVEHTDTALGVAVRRAWLEPMLSALISAEVQISFVCPLALFSAVSVLSIKGPFSGLVFLHDPSLPGIDVVQFDAGKLVNWSTVPHLASDTLAFCLPGKAVTAFMAVGLSASEISSAETALNCGVESFEADHAQRSAIEAAIRRLSVSPITAPVDLRTTTASRDPALSRARLAAALTGIAALIALSAAMLFRAAGYDAVTTRLEADERAAFTRALPGQPLPLDPASRLASESRRLQGVVGEGGKTPARAPGTARLAHVITALPPSTRFDILDLRLSESTLALEGRIRRHEDAETIADALRAVGDLTVETPATEQLADGIIGFSLTGTWQPPSSPTTNRPGDTGGSSGAATTAGEP